MTTAPDDVWAATAGGNTTINRDRWGRPLIIPPGGGKPIPYTRCTTYVGSVDDLYGLMGWKQRQTAVGLAARRDLHLRAASLGPQPADPVAARTWKAQMDDVCEQAMEAAGSSEKATIGTALHTFTEGIDRGLPVTPPADYAPHLDSYRAATAGWGMEHVEAFVVLDDLLIGGTADRIVTIPGERGRFIADVKTGSIDYPHKMAMQLAVYSRSVLYDTATGTRTPVDWLRTDAGIIIHLDAATGRCSLHWADLDAGWEAVQLATQVRAWRKRRDILAQDPTPAPTPTPATAARMPKSAASVAVSVAIGCAATVDQLITLRQATGDAWTDEHTAQLRARLVHITQTPGA